VVREDDWQAFATNGTFHPVVAGSTWELTAGPETIDGLIRTVTIENVSRNTAGAIVTSGGTVDPSTKKVTISVSWNEPTTGHVESVHYLTRYLDNLSLTETTEADFTPGTSVGTAVVNNAGGEIILGSGGKGDWCEPNDYIVAEYDLPQGGKAKVVKAKEGTAFTGTDSNTGVFVELGISQDDPPQISQASSIAGYETHDLVIDDNYAYIATGDTSKDVVIIDLNTNSEVGYFNDTHWWGTANGVFVKGNVGYVTIGPKLHTFDLSSKSGQRPELDSVDLSPYWWYPATGYRLKVIGDYAYVALDFGDAELRLVNVSNPSNISRAGSANVNSERGKDVYVNETGTRAYLITDLSPNKRELFIINTQNKSGNLPMVGEYDANGMNPQGLALGTENKLIVVGTGGDEYQVIDISNESNPTLCGSVDIGNGIYGVSTVLEEDGEAFSYIVTKDGSAEFKIIEGGAGDAFASIGTFESKILTTSYPTAFNYILSDITLPLPGITTAQYQVAVADQVSGSCTNANYVYFGPDGTSSTFYDDEGAIPLNDDGVGYENPGQCFRYKVYLETADSSSTPIVNSMIVNYSP
ncbi:MAG: hypothetical protein QG639_449, partial [Patescibacteria group bacterium]|nr:hypothetical protein [Patescibacteria group bacterium]